MIVRTERDIKYRAMTAALRDAGYQAISKPLMQPYRLYGLLMVACNVIGEMMSVHPYRVWQALYVRVRRATAGTVHKALNSSYVRAGSHQETEELHILCPCCGADLLTAGAPTKEEIVRDVMAKSGQLPQKSPHSREDEGKSLHTIGKAEEETGKVAGAGCTGGGDPAGAVRPND